MNFFARHAYSTGCVLAGAIWPFFVRRRRLSVENLLKCGITADVNEARRIAKRAFCHFTGHIFEALFVPGVVSKANWREHIDTTGVDPSLVKLITEAPSEPIMIVSGHHGCWEAATNILSIVRPMIAIARVMDNKLLAKWMKNHHFRGPVTIINKNDGFKRCYIEQWLKTNAAMTILTDQHSYGGAHLKFFGRPARTVTSAARLAIKYGCPVAIGSFVRIAPFKYRLVGGAPLKYGKDADRDAVAQEMNDRLEAAIREYPEQYLWMHRRWRED